VNPLAIDVVMTTYGRAQSVAAKAQWVLGQPDVASLTVVVDGPDELATTALGEVADHRLTVLVLERNEGPEVARNAGIAQTTATWIAVLDDDDEHLDGFLGCLRDIGIEAGAGVVGAPWLNVGTADPARIAAAAPHRAGGPGPSHPGVFPLERWERCLWIPNNVLVRRDVAEALQFDTGFRGNYWRDETDFFVRAQRAGHDVVVTGLTYSWLRSRPGGGIERQQRWLYEWWVLRNNWRFLRRHGRWLHDRGETAAPIREQLSLVHQRCVRPALSRLRPRSDVGR
jgi:glycosyltransferase involved in cell wall biosynthesis